MATPRPHPFHPLPTHPMPGDIHPLPVDIIIPGSLIHFGSLTCNPLWTPVLSPSQKQKQVRNINQPHPNATLLLSLLSPESQDYLTLFRPPTPLGYPIRMFHLTHPLISKAAIRENAKSLSFSVPPPSKISKAKLIPLYTLAKKNLLTTALQCLIIPYWLSKM